MIVIRITLRKATISDCEELYGLQIASFRQLLSKYQDFDISPGAEKIDRTMQRLQEAATDYYFICLSDKHIGAVRVCHFHTLCKLKQIYILPEFQGAGHAQKAIALVESFYPEAKRWELDTIGQEAKLCHLYEKMGYAKTGEVESIKEGMDIVYFAKEV